MITGFLLTMIYGLLVGLLNMLPVGSAMPDAVLNAASALGRLVYSWNLLLPVTDLLVVIGLTITLLFGLFAVRTIFYVISLFRGNSMPGTSARLIL